MIYRDGVVTKIIRTWRGSCQVEVAIEEGPTKGIPPLTGQSVRAISYERIVGPLGVGQRVRLECSALARRLGTGGSASVVTNLSALPPDYLPEGHMVKARYMPTQVMVAASDEQDASGHEQLANLRLKGTPVVAADLHSQLPAIIAGAKQENPGAKIAYVMTDGASLPLPLSMQVAALVEAGWIDATVTAGQAWGGDYEAVSIPSAIQIAKLKADPDLIIVSQGPGNLGGDTEFGFSGVDVAWALTSAAALEAKPIAALRISGADKRSRHFGLSHHTHTALAELTAKPALLPLPRFEGLPGIARNFDAKVRAQVERASANRHSIVPVDAAGAWESLLKCPVKLSTMGRSLEQDAAIFISAWAAGNLALQQS